MTHLVLFELFVTNFCLSTNKKLLISWQFSGPYGINKYGSGWRKDVVNQCLEFDIYRFCDWIYDTWTPVLHVQVLLCIPYFWCHALLYGLVWHVNTLCAYCQCVCVTKIAFSRKPIEVCLLKVTCGRLQVCGRLGWSRLRTQQSCQLCTLLWLFGTWLFFICFSFLFSSVFSFFFILGVEVLGGGGGLEDVVLLFPMSSYNILPPPLPTFFSFFFSFVVVEVVSFLQMV